MQQAKLDNYFKIIPKYDERNKKCFIYDPLNYKAFFDTKPEPTDKYITLKIGIRLFYREPPADLDITIPTGTQGPAGSVNAVGSHLLPTATNTWDLGSATLRWRNIYTNDLQLSNGIGDYTIVEGEEDLFLYNNIIFYI